ncbi:MAG: SoxR reducing system RseC family protein [Chromatiaceae bacterium]|jgi:sigma-E factor negative regulatory protein RseC
MGGIRYHDRVELVEGLARVVEIKGDVAWLEPEQTTTCGGCAASGACGAKDMGTVASRVATRRFPLIDHPGLQVGERILVGVRGDALLKASLTAYALPLVTLFVGAGLAQWVFGQDGATLAGSLGGLVLGLLLARLGASRLLACGASAPRYLRRAGRGS